jgi:outer membrane protein OmpA-like peptidoglycan-associated protein
MSQKNDRQSFSVRLGPVRVYGRGGLTAENRSSGSPPRSLTKTLALALISLSVAVAGGYIALSRHIAPATSLYAYVSQPGWQPYGVADPNIAPERETSEGENPQSRAVAEPEGRSGDFDNVENLADGGSSDEMPGSAPSTVEKAEETAGAAPHSVSAPPPLQQTGTSVPRDTADLLQSPVTGSAPRDEPEEPVDVSARDINIDEQSGEPAADNESAPVVAARGEPTEAASSNPAATSARARDPNSQQGAPAANAADEVQETAGQEQQMTALPEPPAQVTPSATVTSQMQAGGSRAAGEAEATEATQPCHREMLQQVVADTVVRFRVGSANVPERFLGDLRRLGEAVETCPAARIEIAGHSDPLGAEGLNFELSWKRAEAVGATLAEMGFSMSSYITVGYGARQPVEDFSLPPVQVEQASRAEQSEEDLRALEARRRSLEEQRRQKLVRLHAVNRRVEFRIR